MTSEHLTSSGAGQEQSRTPETTRFQTFNLMRQSFMRGGLDSPDSLHSVASVHTFLNTEVAPIMDADAVINMGIRISEGIAILTLTGASGNTVPWQDDGIKGRLEKQFRKGVAHSRARMPIQLDLETQSLDQDPDILDLGTVTAANLTVLTIDPVPDIPAGWGQDYHEIIISPSNPEKYRDAVEPCEDSECSGQASLSYYTTFNSLRGSLTTTALLVVTNLPVLQCNGCQNEQHPASAVSDVLLEGDRQLREVGVYPPKSTALFEV